MSWLKGLFGRRQPLRRRREVMSLVVLSNSYVELTLDELRSHLDAIYRGYFLPRASGAPSWSRATQCTGVIDVEWRMLP